MSLVSDLHNRSEAEISLFVLSCSTHTRRLPLLLSSGDLGNGEICHWVCRQDLSTDDGCRYASYRSVRPFIPGCATGPNGFDGSRIIHRKSRSECTNGGACYPREVMLM